jgi:hypothetical protein
MSNYRHIKLGAEALAVTPVSEGDGRKSIHRPD